MFIYLLPVRRLRNRRYNPLEDARGDLFVSTRMPIFRAFPRVGIPPRYEDFADWESRMEFMVAGGVMPDYTYLWYPRVYVSK